MPDLEVHPGGASGPSPEPDVAFYFDLGSPYAYLSAERISRLFADSGLAQPEWKPVLLGGLFARFERGSWALTDVREEGMREVERRAQAQALQPIRWPDPFPANTLHAMRVATYAKSIGRTISFTLAAFPMLTSDAPTRRRRRGGPTATTGRLRAFGAELEDQGSVPLALMP